MVKIDMGAHIDGFIAVVAHTVVISDEKTKITGRKADTILAAHLASEAALRLVKPGNEVCSIVLAKVSFFWDQSQDMGSSSFLLKKQVSDYLTYLVYKLEACFLAGEITWTPVLNRISEKTDFGTSRLNRLDIFS